MMRKEQIYVIKASGQAVPFNSNKVKATCIRAGASKKLAEQVVKKVREQLRNGMRTRDVYRMVLNALAAVDEGQIIKH
ncbi:MAG: ATP cone domain-containing protein, partial [Thermoproteota archaeon]